MDTAENKNVYINIKKQKIKYTHTLHIMLDYTVYILKNLPLTWRTSLLRQSFTPKYY